MNMKKLKNRKKKRNLALAVTGTGVAFIGSKTYFNNRRKRLIKKLTLLISRILMIILDLLQMDICISSYINILMS